MKTTEQTIYTWGRREDLTKKGKKAKPDGVGPKPSPTPAHRWEKEEWSREWVGAQDH